MGRKISSSVFPQRDITVARLPPYENRQTFFIILTRRHNGPALRSPRWRLDVSSLPPQQKLSPAPPRHFHNHFIRAMWSDSRTERKTLPPIWTAKALPEWRACLGQIRGFGRTGTVESVENSTSWLLQLLWDGLFLFSYFILFFLLFSCDRAQRRGELLFRCINSKRATRVDVEVKPRDSVRS